MLEVPLANKLVLKPEDSAKQLKKDVEYLTTHFSKDELAESFLRMSCSFFCIKNNINPPIPLESELIILDASAVTCLNHLNFVRHTRGKS